MYATILIILESNQFFYPMKLIHDCWKENNLSKSLASSLKLSRNNGLANIRTSFFYDIAYK